MVWRLVFEGGIAPSELGLDLKDPDTQDEANEALNIYVDRMNKSMQTKKPKGR